MEAGHDLQVPGQDFYLHAWALKARILVRELTPVGAGGQPAFRQAQEAVSLPVGIGIRIGIDIVGIFRTPPADQQDAYSNEDQACQDDWPEPSDHVSILLSNVIVWLHSRT